MTLPIDYRNNVIVDLDAAVAAWITTISVNPAQQALLPNGVQNTIATLEEVDANGVITLREGILITNRAANVLTVQRAYQAMPQDDSATTHVQISFPFDPVNGARLGLYWTRAHGEEINDIYTDEILPWVTSGLVHKTTNEVIDDLKEFTTLPQQSPTYVAPTIDEELVPKKYVDDSIIAASGPFIFWDGSDWAYVAPAWVSTLNFDQVYNFTSFDIPVGSTVTGTWVGDKLLIKVTGTATVDGTLDVWWAATESLTYQPDVLNQILNWWAYWVWGNWGTGWQNGTWTGWSWGAWSIEGYGWWWGGWSWDSGNEDGWAWGPWWSPGWLWWAAVSGIGTDPGNPGWLSAWGSWWQAWATSVSGAGWDAYGNNGWNANGWIAWINNRAWWGWAAGWDRWAAGWVISIYATTFAGTWSLLATGLVWLDGWDGGTGAVDADWTAAWAWGWAWWGWGWGWAGGIINLVWRTNTFGWTIDTSWGLWGNAWVWWAGANGWTTWAAGTNGWAGTAWDVLNILLKDTL